jgi:hypothetical protein
VSHAARLALALALVCFSCGRPAEAVERDRVLHALDALRDAPAEALAERRELLADLAVMEARGPFVVRARDTCAAAYRFLLDGTELRRGVQAELETDAGPTTSLVPRLLDAETKIKQSGALMPDCQAAIAALRLGRR